MSDYIPAELWAKVLLKTPIKTVIQCTAVCKQWHSLITSPSFIDTHLSLSRRRQDPLLFFTPSPSPETHQTRRSYFDSDDDGEEGQHYFVTFQTDPLQPSQDSHRPFPARSGGGGNEETLFYRVVGSIDGLVCLSDDTVYGYTNIIILWNPLIHQSFELPRPNFTFATIGPFSLMVGFGFDSSKNDYKIVRVLYRQGNCEDLLPPLVEVYSVKQGFWRRVSAPYVQCCIREHGWTQCFIHGAVHWIGYKKMGKRRGYFKNVILLFDVSSDIFSTMVLPESLVDAKPKSLSISVIGGLVSIFHWAWGKSTDIWVQREYGVESSWTKRFTLAAKLEVSVPLQWRRTVELEMSEMEQAYDSKDLQLPGRYSSFGSFKAFYAFRYTESLVLLNKESWPKNEETDRSDEFSLSESDKVLTRYDDESEEDDPDNGEETGDEDQV